MNVQLYKSAFPAIRAVEGGVPTVVFIGDCIVIIRRIPDRSVDLTITSPPYCMGKEYEKSRSIDDFVAAHEIVLREIVRITRDGGSICWQVGYHIANQIYNGVEVPTKGKKSRNVDIDSITVGMLVEYLGDRTTGRVFQGRNGAPMHAFRHGRNSKMKQENVPNDLILRQVGHSSLKVNSGYTHTAATHTSRKTSFVILWSGWRFQIFLVQKTQICTETRGR